MSASWIVYLSWVFLATWANGQGEIEWQNSMDGLELPEDIQNGVVIATLSATYQGSSNNIIYGINENVNDPKDITVKEQGSRMLVFQNGTVMTYNAEFKFESGITSVSVNLIARVRGTDIVNKKTSVIKIRDVNNLAPVFTKQDYTATVVENYEPPGGRLLLVGNITVEDIDTVLTDIKWLEVIISKCTKSKEEEETRCGNRFSLERTLYDTKSYTGNFYIHEPLDYEDASSWQVTLQAFDGKQSVASDVIITVEDMQDSPPDWTYLQRLYTADDNQAPHSNLGYVVAIDTDGDVARRRPIYYTMLPTVPDPGNPIDPRFYPERYFYVDGFTGVLYNNATLDLESPPLNENPNENLWSINLMACEIISETPLVIGQTLGLDCVTGITRIRIDDLDDNRPVFNRAEYVYYIQEDIRNGQGLGTPAIEVSDPDSEEFNKFTVKLLTPSQEFMLAGSDTSPDIRVKNSRLIDYESGITVYRLQLEARGDVNMTLFSVVDVTIHILDANDNKPRFDQASYLRYVNETAAPGTNIIRIQATDIDTGLMGTAGIKYSLVGSATNLFEINPDSGLVTVGQCPTPGVHPCLDFERAPNDYEFKVKAHDENGAERGLFNFTSLTIKVLDENDNSPEVDNYKVSIFEWAPTTNPDLYVEATDLDQTDVLEYSIVSQPLIKGAYHWAIDPSSGHVTPIGDITTDNSPSNKQFVLEVQVHDGNPDHNAFSTVTITVIDINDHAPVFFPRDYLITIPEGTYAREYLDTVSASDKDDPTSDNGRISYQIEGGGEGKFEINRTSGEFYTTDGAVFEYDIKRQYQILVKALDKGNPQLSGNSTVTVIITDENNKLPKVEPNSQRGQVLDNVPINTYVMTLSAVDPDQDANLTFYIIDATSAITPDGAPVDKNVYDYTDLFWMEVTTGKVYTKRELDSDKTSIVNFVVAVYDITPAQRQEGRGTMIIDIKKWNKEPPRFGDYDRYLEIPEGLNDNTFIMSFIATDEDGYVDSFQIVQQPDDFFKINSDSGFVTTTSNKIDYDPPMMANGSYFVVEVTDSGEPQKTATARVDVTFRNINDHTPEFTQTLYIATIDENEVDGYELLRVRATDGDRPDSNGFADIRYSMTDDRFDVDPITGQVFVRLRGNGVLDREEDETVVVTIIAYDTPDGPLRVRRQTTASLVVTLRDKNDNAPTFSKREYYGRIYETIEVKTTILQLFASDIDLGNFSEVAFRKIPGSGDDIYDYFGVSETDGNVFVAKDLTRHVGTYTFDVRATDEYGSGPFSAFAKVTIDVLPSANTPPIILKPAKDNDTVEVLEEQYRGMIVYRVVAVDFDTGRNGVVEYMFVHEGQETVITPEFQINPITGVITARIIYDREKTDRYVLLLKAKDYGSTRLEDTRFLTVIVIDVNDNRPYFKDDMLDYRVQENAERGTEVKGNKPIEAFDLDLDPEIFYHIISGNEEDNFRLDRITGKLYTNKKLDRETKSIYMLNVQATNDEADYTVIRSRRRRSTDPSIVLVKITVGDINDAAPVFLGEPYYGCVSSRSWFDKNIMTVSAKDYDAVGTGIVRYRLMEQEQLERPLFGIDEKFGVISNKVIMRDYLNRVFELTVNARDREVIENSNDVNTTALIFVTQPAKEVKLQITQNTAEVRLYQNQIRRIIEQAGDLDKVCINLIRDHVINTAGDITTLWSDVYLSGIRKDPDTGAYFIVTATELRNIINRERHMRPTDFDNLFITDVQAESSDEASVKESFVLIVLIIIAVLVFLGILFIILAYLCIRAAKKDKKSRLIQKTQAAPPLGPIILEQHVDPVVFQAQEPVQYDNRAYVVEQEAPIIQQEQLVVEPPPVHVEYSVVSKTPAGLVPTEVRVPTPEPVDQEDIIIVSQFRDDVQPSGDVYQPKSEGEYTIVTEPM